MSAHLSRTEARCREIVQTDPTGVMLALDSQPTQQAVAFKLRFCTSTPWTLERIAGHLKISRERARILVFQGMRDLAKHREMKGIWEGVW